MVWDRNDWIAAALIIFMLAMGTIVAAMFLGWIPRVNDFFRFQEPKMISEILHIIH